MATVKKPPAEPFPPATLRAAHELIPKLMPDARASLEEWVAFRRRSAAMYAQVADVDRGHHHEALYWAERELQVVDELIQQIKARATDTPKAGGAS